MAFDLLALAIARFLNKPTHSQSKETTPMTTQTAPTLNADLLALLTTPRLSAETKAQLVGDLGARTDAVLLLRQLNTKADKAKDGQSLYLFTRKGQMFVELYYGDPRHSSYVQQGWAFQAVAFGAERMAGWSKQPVETTPSTQTRKKRWSEAKMIETDLDAALMGFTGSDAETVKTQQLVPLLDQMLAGKLCSVAVVDCGTSNRGTYWTRVRITFPPKSPTPAPVAQASEEEAVLPESCQATTKAGARCRCKPLANGYCKQHQPAEPKPAAPAPEKKSKRQVTEAEINELLAIAEEFPGETDH